MSKYTSNSAITKKMHHQIKMGSVVTVITKISLNRFIIQRIIARIPKIIEFEALLVALSAARDISLPFLFVIARKISFCYCNNYNTYILKCK